MNNKMDERNKGHLDFKKELVITFKKTCRVFIMIGIFENIYYS